MYTVHSTLYAVHFFALYILHYTLYTVHYVQCTV